MPQARQQENPRASTYRLQTTAHANRWAISTSPAKINVDNGRWDAKKSNNLETLSQPRDYSIRKQTGDSLLNHKIRQRSKSLNQLSINNTNLITNNPQHAAAATPHASFQDKPESKNQEKSHSKHLSFVSSSTALVINPTTESRPKTARLSTKQAPVPTMNRHRRRRFSLEEDPTKVAMKISLPCTGGCCYCVFSALLGPVKVYITRADKPKKEPLLLRIKDGNGKAIIPVSRKSDVKGLVYDPVSFSLHPPVKGHGRILQKRQKQRK